MIDKKIDQKEAEEFKTIYNHYLDKRKEIMKKLSSKMKKFLVILVIKTLFHLNK